MAPKPSRRDVAIVSSILLVGVVAMLAFHNSRTGGEFSRLLYGDESSAYLPAAEAIRDQGFGFFFTERSLWTGPLNPLWIASLAGRIALVKVANIVLFVLAGIAVWDMARRLFDSRAGYIAVAFYATYLPFFKFTPTLLSEPLFVPLVVFALWFAVLGPRYGEKAVFASGVLLGLATLVRPTLQLYPLFLLVVWALGQWVTSIRRTPQFSVEAKKVLLIGIGFAVIVAPYAMKNLVSLNKVGIANGAGAVLYIGNDLRTHGYEPVDSQLVFNTKEISAPYTHLDTEGDRLLLDAALDQIARDPIDVALLQPSKALRLVFGSPEHYFRPSEHAIEFFEGRAWVDRLNLWELAVTPLLVLVGIAGLIFIRVSPLVKLVFGSFVAYMLLINTVLFPIPRMFLAAFPALMVFTGGAWSKLSRKITLGAAGAAGLVVLFIAFEGVFGTTGTVSERYVEYFEPIAETTTADVVRYNDAVALPTGSIRSTGTDPFVVVDIDDFEATRNQMIFVTIRAPSTNGEAATARAQVFWRTDLAGFAEERSQLVDLIDDGELHTYAVSPSFRRPWSGVISEIRIDFPDHQSGTTYKLDTIEVRK